MVLWAWLEEQQPCLESVARGAVEIQQWSQLPMLRSVSAMPAHD